MGITFTGGSLDRATEHRGDRDWLAAQAADPAARAVIAVSDGIYVTGDDRLALVPLNGMPTSILLGRDATGPVFAVEGPPHAGTDAHAIGLRAAAAQLPHADAGLAAYAAAMLNWHRGHPHCSVCGAATDVGEGGLVRSCPNCGAQHHPRTDPVVIMLVTDGDRVLLGRQPSWPPGRYSALAGFVEPGESLEEAVAREVREEAGVELGQPQYIASQPWPFPSSLMVGFIAPWIAGEPRRIDEELDDVRWFDRADIEAAVDERDGPLGVPPRFAIARQLLEHWVRR
jgi:NAD+ diphosphatase